MAGERNPNGEYNPGETVVLHLYEGALFESFPKKINGDSVIIKAEIKSIEGLVVSCTSSGVRLRDAKYFVIITGKSPQLISEEEIKDGLKKPAGIEKYVSHNIIKDSDVFTSD